MGQYREGTFTTTATPTALNITLGFTPSSFKLTNYTRYATSTAISQALYFFPMAAGSALLQTVNASAIPVQSIITSNGFTPFSNGALYTNTVLTITNIVIATGVVTVSSLGTLANGDTVTISSVVGTIQLNTNRYIVGNISGSTFQLFDFFGNPIVMTSFGTYVSGGQADIISTPIIAPVINPVNGQVITQGQPPGNVYDTGSAGITLGTGLFNSSVDVWYWEALRQTPTGW